MPRVALFITCLTDQFYPRVGIAVTRILEHFGCAVDFPAGQTCCGQPFYNNGFHDEARELAKRMVEIFEPCEYIVTPSGSCCAMVREQFPHLLHGDHAWEEGMHRLASRTYEFVEFLDKVLKVDLNALGVKWDGNCTYHFSCHLRGIGIRDEAVKLIRQIDGLKYTQMEKIEQCRGFGGTFAMKYPDISGSMVRDKVQCIAATGATTVVSNDAGCTMNISGACRREGHTADFRSLAEIIAEGLGLMERPA
jgi:L-lactate dehydrogenase complex protein LldE